MMSDMARHAVWVGGIVDLVWRWSCCVDDMHASSMIFRNHTTDCSALERITRS